MTDADIKKAIEIAYRRGLEDGACHSLPGFENYVQTCLLGGQVMAHDIFVKHILNNEKIKTSKG